MRALRVFRIMKWLAATGRWRVLEPQDIPIRSAMGKEIRRAFVPRSDEFELLAITRKLNCASREMSGDKGLAEAFASGFDIHTATAAAVYGVDPALVDGELRRRENR